MPRLLVAAVPSGSDSAAPARALPLAPVQLQLLLSPRCLQSKKEFLLKENGLGSSSQVPCLWVEGKIQKQIAAKMGHADRTHTLLDDNQGDVARTDG